MATDEWSQGYVADVTYTVGYYRELSPSLQQFILLLQGIAPPGDATEGFDHFELGFGQGFSLNAHALSHPAGRFWGNDFNPDHVLFARGLAAASGTPAQVYDDSFEELLDRDLPQFDYISMHGVWSWISEENKQAIIQFLRRNLKLGGAVYVSYNTLPGWAAAMPLRHLIKQHEELSGALGSARVDRVRGALAFAAKLAAVDANYFKSNAGVADRLITIQKQNASYLAHEYFNRDWTPMYFSDLAGYMNGAKLTYAGSASLLDQVPDLSLTEDMRKILAEIDQPEYRETVRDFLINTQFRRDIFVRGMRRLSRQEALARMQAFRFSLITPLSKVGYSVTIGTRKADLQRDIYEPLVDALDKTDGGLSIAELRAVPSVAKAGLPVLIQALTILLGMGCVSVHAGRNAEPERVKSINRFIARRAEEDGSTGYMVAARAGVAIPLDRFDQLFMRSASEKKTAEQAATAVWEILRQRGERLTKDGNTLTEPAANLAELESHARKFYEESLPRFRAIGVIL